MNLFHRSIKQRLKQLEDTVQMLCQRTVSQKTTQEEAPVSYRQIIDEWQNGAQED